MTIQLHFAVVEPYHKISLIPTPDEALLWNLEGQIVQVRGFWYPLSYYEGILTSQPNLKSCCLQGRAGAYPKFLVRGIEGFSSQKFINLEGKLKIEFQSDEKGKFTQVWIIEHAKEISKSNSIFSWEIVAILSIIIYFMRWLYLRYIVNSIYF